MVSEATAEAADDGAIVVAIFNLLDPNPDQRWPLDGSPQEVRIGSSRVILRLQDEPGRINPNSAPPELLEALLRVTGSDAGSARALAAAIGEWGGSTGLAAPPHGQPAAYRPARLEHGPPGEPLATLHEPRRG